MARPFPYLITNHFPSSLPLTIGIFVSIFALVALCAKSGTKSRKETKYNINVYDQQEQQAPKKPANNVYKTPPRSPLHKTPPRSPLANPKKLLSNISNIKNYNNKNNDKKQENEVMVVDHQNEGFGEGGLWQKGILMGEKCQPLEFSGVIYYDNFGNMTNQPPKSPRASIAASLQGSMSSYPVSTRSSFDFN